LVLNKANPLLNNSELNLTKHKKRNRSNVKFEDLNINYYDYVEYKDDKFVEVFSDQVNVIINNLSYKFFYDTNKVLFDYSNVSL
jgi:hypothetical protein